VVAITRLHHATHSRWVAAADYHKEILVRLTKKMLLLTSSAMSLVLIATQASKAYATQEWPGRCGYPASCEPPYACSYQCIIGATEGQRCVTGSPLMCPL
jgi:hypothetical protein